MVKGVIMYGLFQTFNPLKSSITVMALATKPLGVQQSYLESLTTTRHQSSSEARESNLLPIGDTVMDPLIVCGPSGVGKGTIIDKYMKEMGGSDEFGFTVSHTTRLPRPGEIDGVHYHFSTNDRMEYDIGQGLFLEHAHVHGNLYGTSWDSLKYVQEDDKRCLLDIDVQGVQTLKEQNFGVNWRPRYLFIAPPSLEILLERLRSRGTETPESVRIRTAKAQQEVDYGLACGNFDAIVVNDDLDEACLEFERVVKELYDV
mmetsp:Transcript_27524/g.41650  ORF Transcript_27524/g.41650 Transcript_27524/m.41650 type:complete len:259 (+) Transcript_27524:134-910(+)